MSILIAKSDENIDASNKLIKASLFSSSVHCSYYGCAQLMLHLLRSHFGKTELEISKEGRMGAKDYKGFHQWLQNVIFEEFARLNNVDAAKFNSKIRSLCAARVKADYKVEEIIDKEALKAYDMSVEAKKLLTKNFVL